MPTYGWKCAACGHEWDVHTTIARRDEPEKCSKCPGDGARTLSAPNIDKVAASSWNQQSYNPGLGCWTKSWKHGREIAKARGLEEVGDEATDKIHSRYEARREDIREERWRSADRDMVYE
jgi:putative FmdB family regulatory protein